MDALQLFANRGVRGKKFLKISERYVFRGKIFQSITTSRGLDTFGYATVRIEFAYYVVPFDSMNLHEVPLRKNL